VLIRHADPQRDASACAEIYAPYVSDSVISLELSPPSAEEFAERIAVTSETHPFLLAVQDGGADSGAVAGFAYAGPHSERAGYRWSANVSVYVDPRYHRRGIGRRLYAELFGLLERQGLWTACSGITLPNDASVGLHTACGFQTVGVFHRVAYKHGAWRDVAWLERALRPDADFAGAATPPDPAQPAHLG
jgi:L-amino acid N-acyltransferase YncA